MQEGKLERPKYQTRAQERSEVMEQEIAVLTRAMQTLVESVAEIKPVVLELKEWKPTMIATVDDLRGEVGELRDQIKLMNRDTAPVPRALGLPPLLPTPEHLKIRETKEDMDYGPGTSSQGASPQNRGRAMGVHNTGQSHGNGTLGLHSLALPPGDSGDWSGRNLGEYYQHPVHPKLDFPKFDGENPKAWRLKCEVYFRVCATRPELWVSIATMHFGGNAVLWLQSTQAHTKCRNWEEFVDAICLRFGREEFQQQLRSFNRLKQSGTVTEFAEKFNESMHNLLAHHTWDPMFFMTQFTDGLRSDIRAAVILHQPKNLDTTVSLACLQEEVLETMRRETRRTEFVTGGRQPARTALPLPIPPGRLPISAGTRVDDRRGTDGSRASGYDDKMAALRAYRRAKGLCHTCGEKWSREHRCGPTVQLHVVQELWELMQEASLETDPVDDDHSQGEEILAISVAAVNGLETPKTVRLVGSIQGIEVIMLIDSGSTHSFMREELAEKLQGEQKAQQGMRVRIADGGTLWCVKEFPDCQWQVQGINFTTTLKVIALGCYDVIVGMDWLE